MVFPRRVAAFLLSMILVLLILTPNAAADSQVFYGIGFVNADGLHLRDNPDVSARSLTIAARGDCVVVLDSSGEWYHVLYNLSEGYMYAAYLTVSRIENAELGKGTVTGGGVNLRSGPGTSYSIVDTVSAGAAVDIIGLNMGWLKVIYDGKYCYIRSDFVKLSEIPYENAASNSSPRYYRGGKAIGALPSGAYNATAGAISGISGNQIVAEAQKYLGTPYVYGGATPSGFDCSGFVYYVLKQFGFSPERTPEGLYNMGRKISKAELQPGDIVFFSGNGSTATHCGIYVGNGQFIHSPNSRSVVSYADLTSGYWCEHYLGACRVV